MHSGGTQSYIYIYIYIPILPQTPLPSRLPQNIEQSSLCYTVGPCWVSILNVAMHMCSFQSPELSLPPILPISWHIHATLLNICFFGSTHLMLIGLHVLGSVLLKLVFRAGLSESTQANLLILYMKNTQLGRSPGVQDPRSNSSPHLPFWTYLGHRIRWTTKGELPVSKSSCVSAGAGERKSGWHSGPMLSMAAQSPQEDNGCPWLYADA